MWETLLREIQRRLEQLGASFSRLEQKVTELQQSSKKNWSLAPPQSTGGGSGKPYGCLSPSSGGPWAASGSWPTVAPDDFTTDIYTLDDSPSLVASDATVYYHSSVNLGTNEKLIVLANGDGSYTAINKVC